jgi:hypothetical protein
MVPRTIARTPPPAFLFPNQQCQRPEPLSRPHRLAPGFGGGGYLVASNFAVNRPFSAFCQDVKQGFKQGKSRSWPPEGLPSFRPERFD